MKDFKHIEDKEVRELTLIMQEEAHYHHTMNDFVELIVVYGWDKVIGDLRQAMGEKKWWTEWTYGNFIVCICLNIGESES